MSDNDGSSKVPGNPNMCPEMCEGCEHLPLCRSTIPPVDLEAIRREIAERDRGLLDASKDNHG